MADSFVGAVKEFKDKVKNAPVVDTSALVSKEELQKHLQATFDAVFTTIRRNPALVGG